MSRTVPARLGWALLAAALTLTACNDRVSSTPATLQMGYLEVQAGLFLARGAVDNPQSGGQVPSLATVTEARRQMAEGVAIMRNNVNLLGDGGPGAACAAELAEPLAMMDAALVQIEAGLAQLQAAIGASDVGPLRLGLDEMQAALGTVDTALRRCGALGDGGTAPEDGGP
ncbi:MAG TPA: hypothetical protein VGQ83_41430 [Polyangia bacterium]|jgi:hypothetical protein